MAAAHQERGRVWFRLVNTAGRRLASSIVSDLILLNNKGEVYEKKNRHLGSCRSRHDGHGGRTRG